MARLMAHMVTVQNGAASQMQEKVLKHLLAALRHPF